MIKLKNMIEIIPAIMPQSYDDLDEKMSLFVGVVPLVQLDIMDGKFVPARTWPYPRDAHFDAIVAEEDGMPSWEDIDFEVDLMIENPVLVVPKWVSAGAQRIIVHVESMKNGMEDFEKIRASVPVGLIELGLAINTTTPLSVIEQYVDRVDFVQCMGIARIGFQGEAFDERVLEHVRALRSSNTDLPISIDGSVNFDTAQRLVEAGATRLVSGSAILEADNFVSAIAEMKNLVS
ncbi:MAG: Ribulose-phosphate 3-epimerase [Parcubacteria group bacterium GW2011_GWC1_42_11]|nr:MAG: Ribulose-phosphate 3-epimerase [Parcubacteria group bacterium GW2011_GWC1_42_11]